MKVWEAIKRLKLEGWYLVSIEGGSTMSTYRYPVVIEGEGTDYGAYVPDLLGCIAVGDSSEEVLSLMRGALRMHLAAMVKDGDPIPEPSAPEALHLVPGIETVRQLEVEVGVQV